MTWLSRLCYVVVLQLSLRRSRLPMKPMLLSHAHVSSITWVTCATQNTWLCLDRWADRALGFASFGTLWIDIDCSNFHPPALRATGLQDFRHPERENGVSVAEGGYPGSFFDHVSSTILCTGAT